MAFCVNLHPILAFQGMIRLHWLVVERLALELDCSTCDETGGCTFADQSDDLVAAVKIKATFLGVTHYGHEGEYDVGVKLQVDSK